MTEPIDITESAFCMFLARVRTGRIEGDDWQSFAATHYAGYPRIEEARRRLVQVAISLGQTEDCLVPPGLPEKAQEILVSLDPNYS